ncbi:hypothetical protein GTP46_08280 [Duganella sp. FT135W]|uniref:Uncharacterized protein n=1 Tax=Duganella flavida TaxID=2692175 RepID=A0A6L8KDX4_9BURK|nr:hypothetical protein [Duganella flavida]MYM22641.1 hypothetical protein [Duganella flavida]
MPSYSEYLELIENLKRNARIARIAEITNAKALILQIMQAHGLAIIESRGRLEIGVPSPAQSSLKPRARSLAGADTRAGKQRSARRME